MGAQHTPLPTLRAIEWSCHADNTIVGDVDGKQVVFAEVAGNGRYGDEDAVIAAEIVRRCNAVPELLEALEFARGEAITARGVLWTKADAAEAWPDGARHAAVLRRSAEKLDEVVRRCDAALAKVRP